MGRRHGRVDPSPDRGSDDADGVRASKLEHAVEDMDYDLHTGRLAFVDVRAQAVAKHVLEARHVRLEPGTQHDYAYAFVIGNVYARMDMR